ncbi:MAG: hypothetical protein VX733_10195 [Candidatus Latescibacterota bacterium]|nr:hypothetical protein [Candidatus Latescibacterota bacterium]
MSSLAAATTTTTVHTAGEFLAHWDDTRNFLIGPELVEFDSPMPPDEEIVDILRRDENARVQFIGMEADEQEKAALAERFRTDPLEQIVDFPFSLSHFSLRDFYAAGEFLQNFQSEVMIPWRTFLASTGLTWQRCYPIFFISGKNCHSTYHVDVSHVAAWQVHGEKTFIGYKRPEAVNDIQDIVDDRKSYVSNHPPAGIDPDDLISYRMAPGDLLWNQLLTPHWVEAGADIAVSINISHGGLAYQGRFCPNEQVLRARWEEHPDEAWLVDERY